MQFVAVMWVQGELIFSVAGTVTACSSSKTRSLSRWRSLGPGTPPTMISWPTSRPRARASAATDSMTSSTSTSVRWVSETDSCPVTFYLTIIWLHVIWPVYCQGTTESSKKQKLFLMSWCPDSAKIKKKMLYASSFETLKKSLVSFLVSWIGHFTCWTLIGHQCSVQCMFSWRSQIQMLILLLPFTKL